MHVMVMPRFTSAKWKRERRSHMDEAGPLWWNMFTEELETGFEEHTAFVPASVVGNLMETLFERGVLSIDDLRNITGNESLEVTD